MFTAIEFRCLLSTLRKTQSLATIGRSLGVTHAAVQRWYTGSRVPSVTVLLLAERLWGAARELPAGLPNQADSQRGG